MSFRRILYIIAAFFLLVVKFAIDVISKNVGLELVSIGAIREIAVAGAFVLIALAIGWTKQRPTATPIRRIGILLVAVIVMLLLMLGISTIPVDGFDAKNYSLSPLDYLTLFIASLESVLLGVFTLGSLSLLRDLVYAHRKKWTSRRFVAFLALLLATAAASAFGRPLASSLVGNLLFVLTLIAAIVNSFQLPWIVYLSKREKIFNLIYGFLLFVLFVVLSVVLSQNGMPQRSLVYYSAPLREFVVLSSLFGSIFFGMAFVSTLFHLPTADAFDRKRTEVTSLHTLGKLITQVFDFRELVDTVTSMTLQVCDGGCAWLELVQPAGVDPAESMPDLTARRTLGDYTVIVAGTRNIEVEEIGMLMGSVEKSVRETILGERRRMVIDDLATDTRSRRDGHPLRAIHSLVGVPLVSHRGLVGILYAAKDTPFGFSADDLDVITGFADQSAIAIENSRLIKESIARERLDQEMMLARALQRSLLPQTLPRFPMLEIDAVSTPAFEVGGDYYDVIELAENTIGIVVGDVSGKGVPAAFYMSEVKGIFQSLAGVSRSPKDFLVRANEVLCRSIDKHSFVSLIYAVVNAHTGRVQLARAGHCPMLLMQKGIPEYVRPDGMGMGLSAGVKFEEAVREQTIQLEPGDVCILYTDGVTEARQGEEEFGYERLLAVAHEARERSASGIKEEILKAVRAFIGTQANHDDMTLVVLKWGATGGSQQQEKP